MKIVATVDQNVFLAEIRTDEIDLLAGKKVGNTCTEGYYNHYRAIPPGTTFNIVKAFDQIHRNNERKNQVNTLKQTLNMMLVGLEMVDPIIEELKVEEKEQSA